MTKHWPLLDREGGHTGWSGSRRTGRPWGIASCWSPRSSGWTSSQRCAESSYKPNEPSVELKTGGAERRGGKKRADQPKDGHFRRLVQELVHTVHHPGVKLNQVHHLGQVGVFPQWERRLVDARVSLTWNKTNKVENNTFKSVDIR